jgi:hypothetical protein
MPWHCSAFERPAMCIFVPVDPHEVGWTIALHFTADRDVVATEPAAYLSKAQLEQPQVIDDITIF